MFYSQFILAKKGPLGTIWIAAHLERKLRKNQVADTDIGVSVDSILFPDVPIALRLSSHLLLGVVRIYSKKVNYLFDDCSEALLKVKQAFRSTTVDLAPEESTAPYHSITLPETFDLDDFELPDNEIFQGNYVDQHVSAREQITLQDTMDGVVYSTSQFGLDERFGDGDTSQINLDLDAEVILDKDAGTGSEGVPGADQDASGGATAAVIKDETTTGAAEAMVVDGSEDQVEDLAAHTEFNEYAQAPQTPGLVEVPNLSSARKELVCDDHMEVDHNASESVAAEKPKNASSELDIHQKGKYSKDWSSENNINHGFAINIPPYECGDIEKPSKPGEVSPLSVVAGDYPLVDGKIDAENELERAEQAHVDSPCCSHITMELEHPGQAPTAPEGQSNDDMIDNTRAHASVAAPSLESPSRPTVDTDNPISQEPKDPDPPIEMQGGQCHETDSRRSDEQAENLLENDNQLEKPTGSVGFDLPAPEKLLSLPGLTEKEHHLMVESTPEKDDFEGAKRDAGTQNISGKKRTFTESTLTTESFISVESVGLIRSRRTADFIPDDDDLLSSILVGRSSFLKMKSTPVLEVASTKRLRSTLRSSTSKRKVLMDDPMVLHGDIIRQQLINTEDIHRVRKKAPCSRPEILMIHRQFLEDELFKEPIFTGLSVELVSLHSEPYDLNEIKIVESDPYHGAVKDAECSASMAPSNDVQEQPAETLVYQHGQQSEDHHNQGNAKDVSGEKQSQPLRNELLGEKSEIEVDKGDAGAADEVNHSIANGEMLEMPTEEKNRGAEDVQVDLSVVDINNRSGKDPIEVVEDDIVLNEIDLKAEDELLPDEIKIDASVEVNKVEANPSAPCDDKIDPFAGASVEIVGEANNDVQIVELESENKNQDCNGVSNEEDKIGSTCPKPDDRENPTDEEVGLKIAMDEGATSQDGFAGGIHEEMENMAIEHDTEFLNVDDDDDDVAEDDNDEGVPYGDETRLLENSGWSSRTRAVSKYLQTLFDKEAEHGKKVLSVDTLLVGKTRKEASRMFFETLVLKTKDYIHAEQATPFGSIDVKPRAKLMKSIF